MVFTKEDRMQPLHVVDLDQVAGWTYAPKGEHLLTLMVAGQKITFNEPAASGALEILCKKAGIPNPQKT